MATWCEISIRVDVEQIDVATSALEDLGYPGCEVREPVGGDATLVIHVEAQEPGTAAALADRINERLAGLGRATISGEVDEAVWTTNWQKFFPRMTIGRRLEVIPPWEEPGSTAAGRRAVVINPGNAFGTGQHETTSSCLELIDELLRPGDLVADIGCGTGVLAISALVLGAAAAVGVDNDPDAVNAARENAVLNGVSDRFTLHLGHGPAPASESGQSRYALVVANIFAEKLVEMADGLTSCVKPGGHLVLSGIESLRSPLVEEAFSTLGWQPSRRLVRAEWTTLALVHGN